MTNKTNIFHLVTVRPWPICASGGALNTIVSLTILMHYKTPLPLLSSLLTSMAISYLWWRDVSRESYGEGAHSKKTMERLKFGIVLFIVSEVIFFLSFFWSYLHRRISPTQEIGAAWPPISIQTFNPISIPLLNTVLLVSSGVTVTWAHHLILKNSLKGRTYMMTLTILLGLAFSGLQGMEYYEAPFSMWDSVFRSTFFMSTGFHGLHVLIGTTFLLTVTIRLIFAKFSKEHLVGFECSAWYWHFVDVVWLFLYSLVYWWGSFIHKVENTTDFQSVT